MPGRGGRRGRGGAAHRGGSGGGAGGAGAGGGSAGGAGVPGSDEVVRVIEEDHPFGPDYGFESATDGSAIVDGGILEGGGQIIRASMACSAILGRPVTFRAIRAGRKQPGLKAQHLAGVKGVCKMFNGTLSGAELKSESFVFTPAEFTDGNFTIDIGTAGSCALVIQISLPCLLFAPAPCSLVIRGGTNVAMAPQVDYLTKVFAPVAARMGVSFEVDVHGRGYFPKGGGEIVLRTAPLTRPLRPIVMDDRGDITAVHVWAFHGGKMPSHISTQLQDAAVAHLARFLPKRGIAMTPVTSEAVDLGRSRDAAAGIIITATTSTGCILAGSGLLERKTKPHQLAMAAADELLAAIDHGGCTDEHLQDQLILFMALADGVSRLKTGPLALHTKTCMYFTSHFLGARFKVTETACGALIECTGCGFFPAGRTPAAAAGSTLSSSPAPATAGASAAAGAGESA